MTAKTKDRALFCSATEDSNEDFSEVNTKFTKSHKLQSKIQAKSASSPIHQFSKFRPSSAKCQPRQPSSAKFSKFSQVAKFAAANVRASVRAKASAGQAATFTQISALHALAVYSQVQPAVQPQAASQPIQPRFSQVKLAKCQPTVSKVSWRQSSARHEGARQGNSAKGRKVLARSAAMHEQRRQAMQQGQRRAAKGSECTNSEGQRMQVRVQREVQQEGSGSSGSGEAAKFRRSAKFQRIQRRHEGTKVQRRQRGHEGQRMQRFKAKCTKGSEVSEGSEGTNERRAAKARRARKAARQRRAAGSTCSEGPASAAKGQRKGSESAKRQQGHKAAIKGQGQQAAKAAKARSSECSRHARQRRAARARGQRIQPRAVQARPGSQGSHSAANAQRMHLEVVHKCRKAVAPRQQVVIKVSQWVAKALRRLRGLALRHQGSAGQPGQHGQYDRCSQEAANGSLALIGHLDSPRHQVQRIQPSSAQGASKQAQSAQRQQWQRSARTSQRKSAISRVSEGSKSASFKHRSANATSARRKVKRSAAAFTEVSRSSEARRFQRSSASSQPQFQQGKRMQRQRVQRKDAKQQARRAQKGSEFQRSGSDCTKAARSARQTKAASVAKASTQTKVAQGHAVVPAKLASSCLRNGTRKAASGKRMHHSQGAASGTMLQDAAVSTYSCSALKAATRREPQGTNAQPSQCQGQRRQPRVAGQAKVQPSSSKSARGAKGSQQRSIA
ncbi:axoneme-associated protein mst101(2)-like [Pomacea canaliculata]|uniref:axoneme-associated protein mst101(2)-like n=1 Tax=Pomacea canaliculata TaxID=400727 RepID=UPI000D73448C|nr:axoneme-associated protein mst101(2)-like [Pomacea canaliculata]